MPPEAIAADPETPPVPQVPQPLMPPKSLSPDDDPNLKLQSIISRRRADKPPDEAKDDKKPEKETTPAKTGDIKKLGGEIGKALGFRDKPVKPDEKKEEKKEEKEEPEKKPDEKPPDKAVVEPADEKTIVTRKKAAPPPPDLVKITTAAATAAVKAAMPEARRETPPGKPEESLKSDDRHEYEVAKYLAEANPSYKDAPKVVLEHVKKAEAYAAQWEKDNKGKVFNPDDDEHDDFYAALEKPWSDHEFRNAEMEMAAERVAERKSSGSEKKIKELEQENARVALNPVIDRTYTAAAGLLAKKMGDDVHEKIVKNTFEKFSEEDPITAGVLAATIGPLQPLIEAAIQLDDPKRRFLFDPKNQNHMEWNRLMLEKESQLAGLEDGSGKTLVSRSEYSAMTQAQMAKHWYLTTEHFIEELVNDASVNAKKLIETGRDGLRKTALAMGYVLKSDAGKNGSASDTPKQPEPKKDPEQKPEPVKPVSPASGAGAKIDDKGSDNPSGKKRLLDTAASILFSR